MKVDWKTFKKSFPYICSNCGEYSYTKKEYCEHCGKKDTIIRMIKEVYEKYHEKTMNSGSKLNESSYYIMMKERQKRDKSTRKSKRRKFVSLILIFISAILIIDLVGFFILMNIFNIPLEEIDKALPILFILVGFSVLVLVGVILATYLAYYEAKILPWH